MMLTLSRVRSGTVPLAKRGREVPCAVATDFGKIRIYWQQQTEVVVGVAAHGFVANFVHTRHTRMRTASEPMCHELSGVAPSGVGSMTGATEMRNPWTL